MQKLTEQGMPAYDAYETILQERQKLSTQQQLRQAGLKLLEEGADEADVAAALESEEPDVAFARIRGKMARGAATGKVAGGGDVDTIKRLSELSGMRDKAIDQDDQVLLAYINEQIKSLVTPATPPAATDKTNPSTGADGAATDTTKTQPPAGDQKIDKPVRWPNEGGVPLGKYEEERDKRLAEAEAKQAEKDRERMGQWTSVKDAITKDFNNDPVAFLNEAKAAVMGVPAKNKAAQKVADFALAQEVGRKVQIGENKQFVPVGGLGAAQPMTSAIMVSPAEALVIEIGLKPADVVGTITEPNGRKREITALEAAEARLNEVLIPLREQQKKDKVEQRQAELTPKVAKGLEKIQGQVNTSK
jgi:hypothetical protein